MSIKSKALMFLFPILMLSCQTGRDSMPATSEVAVPAAEASSAPQTMGPVPPYECPGKVPVCTKEFSPVMCTFSVYAGRPLKAADRLVTWGPNACVGLSRLYQEACKNLMQPRLIGQTQCVPDASGGHCPPPQARCAATVKPSVCRANAYGQEPLSGDQRIIAASSSECLARAKLKMEACRANLDPSLLAKVYCESVAKKKPGASP